MSSTSTSQHRTLLISQTCLSRPLLRSDLTARAMNVLAPLRARCSLSGLVAFEDDGSVKDVASQRDGEMGGGIVRDSEGFEFWPGVDGCDDVWGVEEMRWDLGGYDKSGFDLRAGLRR